MSSGGATLQGSFSGATGTISDVGFYYGTTNNPGTKVSASGTTSPFSKAISGLNSNTTYYYKAYVIEGGEELCGSVESFKTSKASASATVTTYSVTTYGATTATFSGKFENATGTINDGGFYYRTTIGAQWEVLHVNSISGTSGSFQADASGLDESTTYYVKAWVEEYDEASGAYVDRFGSEVSFTTTAASAQLPVYLDNPGMPDVADILSGTGTEGTFSDRNDHWYRYNTTNNKRQIGVHTYTHPTSNDETLNYVVLYDGNKYAPVWTFHVMNDVYWEDKNVGRNEAWTSDPAISLTQQSGIKNAGTNGFSKGHLVASDYRQTTVKQNQQTFYYSNQAPQYQNGFNSGVWSTLEQRVKTVRPTASNIMLYVVTGVLYEGNVTSLDGTSASNSNTTLSVPIPSHFYKCIMKCTFSGNTITNAQGIGFVYTNQSHSDATSYYGTDFNGSEVFVTSIDAIEARAGFDFFAGVPVQYQAAAESNTNHTWFTGKSSSNVQGVFDMNWGAF